MTKDLNALEWLGGNCFRTSHYPYAEERMAECDRRGIAVIAETPGVGLSYFTSGNLAIHRGLLAQLISRDMNHPAVIAWSIANEPTSQEASALPYFRSLTSPACPDLG